MKKIVIVIASMMIASESYSAEWAGKWVDGPAPANYERTPAYLRTYVNMPENGGHAQWTLGTEPTTKTGGAFFSGATSGANAAAAAKVTMPYGGYTAGAAAFGTATLTAAILKPSLAKASLFMLRANPYFSVAANLAWLGYAGYLYFKETDTFQQTAPSIASFSNYRSDRLAYPPYFTSLQSACNATARNFLPQDGWFDPADVTSPWSCYFSTNHSGLAGNITLVNQNNCSAGYTFQNGQCVPGSSIPPVAVTPAQVETGLASAPMTPSGDTDIAKKGIVDELIKNHVEPDTETPVLAGPATVQGGQSTTTRPDGTVETTTNVYNNTYNNNYVDTTNTTTTTTTPPSGAPTTTTTTESPSPPANTTQQQPQKTDCEKYPENIGCSKYGTVPTPDVIPVTNVPLSLNVSGYSDGSCPAPQVMNLSHGTISMSNQPICTLASSSKPLFLALAWLAAGFIVLSPVKG